MIMNSCCSQGVSVSLRSFMVCVLKMNYVLKCLCDHVLVVNENRK